MNRKPIFILIQIFLAGMLFVGLTLVWASFQSFEALASLLNQLATDGELKSFNLSLYRTLRLPFALTGLALVIASGTMLFRWEKTKSWMQTFPTRAKHFFSILGKDAQSFLKDFRVDIAGEGRLANIALLGVALVAAIVRLANLNIPLGHDEPYMYNAFASRSIWHIISNYHLPNNHVLLSILIKITTVLLGNHVWTLRLPTIIAGILMVLAAYFFAKRFYSPETALLSSILVAVFPILVQYSVMARGYIIIGLITLLLFTLGDYVRTQKNRFAWVLIALLSALGFYTIPIMLFPFGALYIWLFVSWILGDTYSYTPKWNFLKFWIASGVGAALITILLYAPIIIYSFNRFFSNGFIAPVDWDIFPVTIQTRLRNTWIEWTLSIPPWIVLLGVFGFLVALIFHKRFSGQKFPPQLAFLIWIVTLLFVRRPDMLPRFWLFLTAPLLVWSVAGVVEPLKRIPLIVGKSWDPARVLVTLIFAFFIVQGVLVIPSLPTQLSQKDEMEKAAIYLKDYVHQSDLVTASVAHLPALRYYFNNHGVPAAYVRQSGKFQRAFIIVDRQRGETLEGVSPKIGFDFPLIDLHTARVVAQFDYLTVYEGYPAQ
jgi:Dolichyl-phosphate-mannose-protein mannosyltransferase